MLEGTCHCGAVRWSLAELPQSATACSCTICRRYGVLWAYGYIHHDIKVSGETRIYRRKDGGSLDFHFRGSCGCVTHYVATDPKEDGRFRTAVNLRLTDPEPIEHLPIRHFDGLDKWKSLPGDNRTVKDLWF